MLKKDLKYCKIKTEVKKMKEQKYILKNIKSFELKDIFDCGQCFRSEEHTSELQSRE